ncbi:MAG: sugar phosphate isomerase/epimerase family protein [Candidatus Bathyarchaeia archaeon]
MKTLTVGISTWVYVTVPIEEAIKRIHGAGIQFVELWGNTPAHLDPITHPRERASEVADTLKALDMTAVSLHAPFSGLNISSANEDVRMVSVASAMRSVEFCREMACPQLVIHLSASPGVKNKTVLDETRKFTVETLDEITDYASKNGVEILLENMIIHPNHLRIGSKVQELLDLVSRFQGRRVEICIDTGHSLLNKQNPSEDIRQAGKHLKSLHINDNDGIKDSHLAPGRGLIDWPAVYSALKDVEYTGVFLFELYGYEVVRETIEQAKTYARRLLE